MVGDLHGQFHDLLAMWVLPCPDSGGAALPGPLWALPKSMPGPTDGRRPSCS